MPVAFALYPFVPRSFCHRLMLLLPTFVYHALLSHAELVYPRECCGALLGKPTTGGWQITTAVPTENICPAVTRYEIASSDLVRIARAARSENLEIAGFYHSHPDAEPEWSPTDLAEAHWLGSSYVIIAVAHGKAAETRSYHLAGTSEEDKHFAPESIELILDTRQPVR